MNLLRRLYGLVIIMRALLPLIWFLVIVYGGYEFYRQITEPLDEISASIDRIGNQIDPLNDGIEQLQNDFSELSDELTGLTTRINAIGTINLDIPPVVIDLSLLENVPLVPAALKRRYTIPPGGWPTQLEIPGMRLLKTEVTKVFCGPDATCALARLQTDFQALEPLVTQFNEDVNTIAQSSQRMAITARDTVTNWARAFVLLLLASILLFGTAYVEYLARNLSRGWALLLGHSHTT